MKIYIYRGIVFNANIIVFPCMYCKVLELVSVLSCCSKTLRRRGGTLIWLKFKVPGTYYHITINLIQTTWGCLVLSLSGGEECYRFPGDCLHLLVVTGILQVVCKCRSPSQGRPVLQLHHWSYFIYFMYLLDISKLQINCINHVT